MRWARVKTIDKLLTPRQYIYTEHQPEVVLISQHENLRGKDRWLVRKVPWLWKKEGQYSLCLLSHEAFQVDAAPEM